MDDDPAEVLDSLATILDYLFETEEASYEECDDEECKKTHVYAHALRVSRHFFDT